MDGMSDSSYFWIMTAQWEVPGQGMTTATFQGLITPHEGATRLGLTETIREDVRQRAGMPELPLTLFFSLEPNEL